MQMTGSVLGVDVGYSTSRRSSAVCRLDWNEHQVSWTIARFRALDHERDEVIKGVAGDALLAAAAFDGPLQPSLTIIGAYRAAERMLSRRLQPFIGKPGQASAPVGKRLNEHANLCALSVIKNCRINQAAHGIAIHQTAIVEAFPSSFLGVMIANPKEIQVHRNNRSDVFYKHLVMTGGLAALIQFCVPDRSLADNLAWVTNHDDRAALVCAVSALCVAAGNYTAVGDIRGWIILPPLRFVQGWAANELRANAAESLQSFCISRMRQ